MKKYIIPVCVLSSIVALAQETGKAPGKKTAPSILHETELPVPTPTEIGEEIIPSNEEGLPTPAPTPSEDESLSEENRSTKLIQEEDSGKPSLGSKSGLYWFAGVFLVLLISIFVFT